MACSADQEEVAISNFDVYVINLFIMRPSRSGVTADSRNAGFFLFFFVEPPAGLFPGLKKKTGEIQWSKIRPLMLTQGTTQGSRLQFYVFS